MCRMHPLPCFPALPKHAHHHVARCAEAVSDGVGAGLPTSSSSAAIAPHMEAGATASDMGSNAPARSTGEGEGDGSGAEGGSSGGGGVGAGGDSGASGAQPNAPARANPTSILSVVKVCVWGGSCPHGVHACVHGCVHACVSTLKPYVDTQTLCRPARPHPCLCRASCPPSPSPSISTRSGALRRWVPCWRPCVMGWRPCVMGLMPCGVRCVRRLAAVRGLGCTRSCAFPSPCLPCALTLTFPPPPGQAVQ